MTTVLLVEDSLTDMGMMTSYLQQAGLEVISAKSGEEAHIVLPGQSGFELCREIKTDPTMSEIPVVLCSTKNTEVDKLWANMLGADAYLPKPVERAELIKTLEELIKQG
jgi:two-component system, chemotaxis family, response regulator PixH